MYDLYLPMERYEAEMQKLKSAIDNIDDNKELVSGMHHLDILCTWQIQNLLGQVGLDLGSTRR